MNCKKKLKPIFLRNKNEMNEKNPKKNNINCSVDRLNI